MKWLTGGPLKWRLLWSMGLAIVALGLFACARGGIGTARTDNANFDVDKLFTVDGCTMWRFYDEGHYHYFAHCAGTSTTTSNQYCGKGCTRQDEIFAVVGRDTTP